MKNGFRIGRVYSDTVFETRKAPTVVAYDLVETDLKILNDKNRASGNRKESKP
jgi:hypothetical protein